MSEDKVYYMYTDVTLNSIYRPYVLGSYVYFAEDDETDLAEFHEKTVAALHDSAEEVREELFDDLPADRYRFSIRAFLRDHYDTFSGRGEDGSNHHGMEQDVYRQSIYLDAFVIATSRYSERLFIYGYTEIAEKIIYEDNVYGRMPKGVYVLTGPAFMRVRVLPKYSQLCLPKKLNVIDERKSVIMKKFLIGVLSLTSTPMTAARRYDVARVL